MLRPHGGRPLSGLEGSSAPSVTITPEDPTAPDATELIRQLSAELAFRYDFADDGSAKFAPADIQTPRAAFLVLRLDGRAVGCGALRPMDEAGFEDACEIKRMYVAVEVRGRRLAAAILTELERLARGFGYQRAVLETGDRNPEAVRLYERFGYERIPPYPPYLDSARSICFSRRLEP